MSTAYVSGLAALMKERQPSLTSVELISQLHESAQGTVDTVPVVDICLAISRAEDGELCTRQVLVGSLEDAE